jgi:hypothetical protein
MPDNSDVDAEDAVRLAAWRTNVERWQTENRKPWRERCEFSIAELAKELARSAGQVEAGRREIGLTAVHIFEWAVGGECGEEEVLLISWEARLVPFLPSYREIDNPWREGGDVNVPALGQWPGGAVQVNIGAVLLTRRAVRALLEICDFPGAPRVSRRMGFEQEGRLGTGVEDSYQARSSPPSPVPDQVEPKKKQFKKATYPQIVEHAKKVLPPGVKWTDKDRDLNPLVRQRLNDVELDAGRDRIRPAINEVLRDSQRNSQRKPFR